MARSTPLPIKVAGAIHRGLYKLGAGRRMFGLPILILTTRGRKSGRDIETALAYLEDAGTPFVIASAGGQPAHPAWYLNLVANPEVRVRIGGEERAFRAEPVAEAGERDRLFAQAVAAYKGYAGYQQKTERRIPVVRLVRT